MTPVDVHFTAWIFAKPDADGVYQPYLVPTTKGGQFVEYVPVFTWSNDVQKRLLAYAEFIGERDSDEIATLPAEDFKTFCTLLRGLGAAYVALDPEPGEPCPSQLFQTERLLGSMTSSLN
jgi:hypothetical protein